MVGELKAQLTYQSPGPASPGWCVVTPSCQLRLRWFQQLKLSIEVKFGAEL